MGVGSELLPQPEGAELAEQFGYVAVRVLDVSENSGIGRTGFHAARQQIFAHPMITEGTLFDHPFGPVAG